MSFLESTGRVKKAQAESDFAMFFLESTGRVKKAQAESFE